MVIKTATSTKRPTNPRPRFGKYGRIYEVAKAVSQYTGYYEKYAKYADPDYYYRQYGKKYTYKPRKRLTGYVQSTRGFLKKKKYGSSRYYKFDQKRSEFRYWNDWHTHDKPSRKSSQHPASYRSYGRQPGVYYQSNILYT